MENLRKLVEAMALLEAEPASLLVLFEVDESFQDNARRVFGCLCDDHFKLDFVVKKLEITLARYKSWRDQVTRLSSTLASFLRELEPAFEKELNDEWEARKKKLLAEIDAQV